MSKLTEKILCSIDYETIEKSRRVIYEKLEKKFKDSNLLRIEMNEEDIPMVYPYLRNDGKTLQKELMQKRIYIPTYWNNVLAWCNSEWEMFLTNNMLALPINNENILSKI